MPIQIQVYRLPFLDFLQKCYTGDFSSREVPHQPCAFFRFPNLSVGVITRDSCRQAFRGGITASQIIRFLNMHVHSKSVASAGPPIPPTVTDQIRLWEQERDR